ncbi:MAG: hypothetical protein H7A22_11845 [Spirochaetales bacterium]|nr:hypothetical protein [Spirochaetales bacterium]
MRKGPFNSFLVYWIAPTAGQLQNRGQFTRPSLQAPSLRLTLLPIVLAARPLLAAEPILIQFVRDLFAQLD